MALRCIFPTSGWPSGDGAIKEFADQQTLRLGHLAASAFLICER